MLKDLLKAALIQEQETRVGKVGPEYAKELDAISKEHDAMHEEMEKKIKAFVEQLKAEHEPVCEGFQRRGNDIWERMHDEIGTPQADREKEYNLDKVTGIITRVDRIPLENMEKSFDEIFKKARAATRTGGVKH